MASAPYIRIFPDTEQSILLKMSLIERGAYTTLKNLYVLNRELFDGSEENINRVFGLCFAFKKEEQDVVLEVLNKFFKDGNDDIDKQIAFNEKQRGNGALGGRPKKNKNPDENPKTKPNKKPKAKPKKTSFLDLDMDKDIVLNKVNEVLNKHSLPKIGKLTDERISKLGERIHDAGSFDDFISKIDKALTDSSFLRGIKTDWRADFDFFMQKSKFLKAIEGGFADSGKSNPHSAQGEPQSEKEEEFYL